MALVIYECSCRGRPSLRQRKKLETRARIIEMAICMFGRRGFDAPTVDDIAAAAEVGKATIYNYFSTKEEVVVAFMVELEWRVQASVRRFSRARGPLEAILADFIWDQIRLKRPYRDFVRIFMAQLFTRGSELRPQFAEMQQAINPPLLDLFQGLTRLGLMCDDVDLTRLIEIFKLLHIGVLTAWLSDRPPYRGTRSLLREEMRLFCQGLDKCEGRTAKRRANGAGAERSAIL